MKEENTILDKSFQFGVEITRLARLIRARKDYDLASQLWRSGTSIGANVEEAQAAQSRADFRSKMSIAAKEARETHYWLRLLKDSESLPNYSTDNLITVIVEIKKILTAIVKNSQ